MKRLEKSRRELMQLVPKTVLLPGRTPYSQPKTGQRASRTEQAVQPRGTRWQHMCHERAGLEHPGTDVRDGEARPPPGSIFWEHGGSTGLRRWLASPNYYGNSLRRRLAVLLR